MCVNSIATTRTALCGAFFFLPDCRDGNANRSDGEPISTHG
jgi:hypothetical protein